MTKMCKLKRVAETSFAAMEALLEGILCSSIFSDKPFSSCWAPFTAGHTLENRWRCGRMYEGARNICIFIKLKYEMDNLVIYRILEVNHLTESASNPCQNRGGQSRT